MNLRQTNSNKNAFEKSYKSIFVDHASNKN